MGGAAEANTNEVPDLGNNEPMTSRVELDDKLLAAIERLGRAVRTARQGIATRHQLSLLQMQVIEHLSGRPALRVGALARALDVTQPTMSEAISALEAKGILQRRPDPSDRRASVLELTKDGGDLATRVGADLSPILGERRASTMDQQAVALEVVLLEIKRLQDNGVITFNRSCLSCLHYQEASGEEPARCLFLGRPLLQQDLRVDCDDHQAP